MTPPANPELNHLAFCALAALGFARQTVGKRARGWLSVLTALADDRTKTKAF